MLSVKGHPTRSSTVYSDIQWENYLAKPECAIETCLSAADADNVPIRGHVWIGDYRDGTFPPEYEKYCFICAFWLQWLNSADDGTVITEHDGKLYHHWFSSDNPVSSAPAKHRGMYGDVVTVQFSDGRKVTTNNLWYQDEIPEWLKNRFTANAEFVKE